MWRISAPYRVPKFITKTASFTHWRKTSGSDFYGIKKSVDVKNVEIIICPAITQSLVAVIGPISRYLVPTFESSTIRR